MAGKRFFKNTKKTMAETTAPEAEVTETVEENSPLAIIVDQDGVLLRVEQNGTELEDGKGFEIFEETVVKEEIKNEQNKTNSEQTEVQDSNNCPECKGSGLENDEKLCSACEGSGKVA